MGALHLPRPWHLLAGASALALLRPVAGLEARLAQPPGGALPTQRRKTELSSEDLIAAGRDADEEDDFDTWYFEHAGNPTSRFKAGYESELEGPEKTEPDPEETSRVAEAWQQCHQGYLSHGAVPLENGVIAYLVTRKTDLRMLEDSLPRLRYYVLRHWAYDVKIFVPSDKLRQYDPSSFHNSPSYEDVLELVNESLGHGEYNFEVATFTVKLPKVIAEDKGWQDKMNACASAVSTSYKHMNQFFTKVMYEHSALNKYKYYLRIDADFSFKAGADGESIKADPFCMMAKTGRKFLWQTRREVGNKRCSDGLWEWFQDYQEANGLTPQDPVFWGPLGAHVNYVGYAGMGDLDFFRSKQVRKLTQALNEDGRVYLNRWSDQTYYVLLFALFENHSAVGDIGFNWGDHFCHKCYNGDFHLNPLTGEVTGSRGVKGRGGWHQAPAA